MSPLDATGRIGREVLGADGGPGASFRRFVRNVDKARARSEDTALETASVGTDGWAVEDEAAEVLLGVDNTCPSNTFGLTSCVIVWQASMGRFIGR